MEVELYKDLYEGYISILRNVSLENASKILNECIKKTSIEMKLTKKEVELGVFNLTSISKISMDVSLEIDILKNLYNKFLNTYESDMLDPPFYYDGNYIFKNRKVGSSKLSVTNFLLLMMILLDKYKYINPNRLSDKYYISHLNNLGLPSQKWNSLQEIYSMNLSHVDTLLIAIYTGSGSYFINNYLRDGKTFSYSNTKVYQGILERYRKLFFKYYQQKNIKIDDNLTIDKMVKQMSRQKYMKKFADFFTERLNKIIYNSPPTDKEFIVYRGTRDLYRTDEDKFGYSSIGFSSTSINVFVALNFSGILPKDEHKDRYNYIEKIIIPKASKVLRAYDSQINHEYEIILPHQSNFKILEECKNNLMFSKYKFASRKKFHNEEKYEEKIMNLQDKIFLSLKNSLFSKKDKIGIPNPVKGKLCLVEYISN
jgi:hypothetical protein